MILEIPSQAIFIKRKAFTIFMSPLGLYVLMTTSYRCVDPKRLKAKHFNSNKQ